jgi:Zn-dependent M28 family amino/carboxypeptidase
MKFSRGLLAALIAATVAGCASHQPPAAVAPLANAPQPNVLADKLMEDVRILSADDMQGRLVGSEGGAKARAYLVGRLAELGVAPISGGAFEHPFPTTRGGTVVTGVNLIGVISGTGGSDRALVLMAHYDHVGVRDGQIYNGADDNASGVAALLSVAASLKQRAPLHDVILALVDGEESGLSGARAMVADPAFKPLLERTVLAVNLDMVSRSDRNELYAAGAYRFPALKPYLEQIVPAAPVTLKLGHDDPALGKDDWTSQSDHMAFHVIGKPWVYFGVEDHPDYHQPSDDFAAIPEDFFRRSAQTVELAVRTFDRQLETFAAESASGGK